AAEFAISPMMIELDSSPGVKENFEFQIHGKKAGTARIFLSDLHQQASGHMAFSDVSDSEAAASTEISQWIRLDQQRASVKTGETITIQGELDIPRRSSGSHVVAIMVEEDRPKNATGISLNVRYAIILSLQIEGRKSRIKTRYEQLSIEQQNGKHYVTAWFSNESNRDSQLESVVFIRNQSSKLLEKVPLKTQSAWQRGDQWSRVFPDSRVKVYGLISKPLSSQNVTLMARNRFAGKMQPSVRSEFAVPETTIHQDTAAASQHQNDIAVVQMKVRKKGQAFGALKIRNPLNTPATLTLPLPATIDGIAYKFSPQVLELPASGSGMVALRQTLKNDDHKPTKYQATLVADGIEKTIHIRTEIR
ncbi:MAG: hypothetical protein VXZ35_09570, partial [Pseudomonadota bacterium]|nr:hypothetical protein [Pseudomonadota bacterium]